MNKKFRCIECNRITQKFYATIENLTDEFDGIVEYCHFCDVGFYEVSRNHFEFVEIEQLEQNLIDVSSSL